MPWPKAPPAVAMPIARPLRALNHIPVSAVSGVNRQAKPTAPIRKNNKSSCHCALCHFSAARPAAIPNTPISAIGFAPNRSDIAPQNRPPIAAPML
jgi:hypothetical protein